MGLRKWLGNSPMPDAVLVTVLALVLRGAVVAWAAPRFPPAGDGQYYHVVAGRIAQGLGYTWQWPDGVVTYAAHYPVGYPAILGTLYALFGAKPSLAMLTNAVSGTFIAWAVHRIGHQLAGRRAALVAGILAAIHPTLVFYTPAVMTELVSAALCIGAAVLVVQRPAAYTTTPWARLIGIALIIGVATLIRPQQLIYAPFFGFLVIARRAELRHCLLPNRARFPWWRALGAGVCVTCIAAAICLPWTLRNCSRMGQCVFVSANGGWNLLIGTSKKGDGAWVPVDSIGVPPECRSVFAEAAKDSCFGKAAARIIREHPVDWLRLSPAKLKKTFDDVGAPGWYLNASAPEHFGERQKVALGIAEVLSERLVMLAALVGLVLVPGTGAGSRARRLLGLAGAACLFYTYAWLSVLLLCLAVLLLGRHLLKEPILLLLCFGYGTTAAIHAVFFGGARYGIVVMPFLLLAAGRVFAASGTGVPGDAKLQG